MALLANIINTGTLAARPAAGTAGSLYYATDTQQLFRDNGASWVEWTFSGAGFANPMTAAGDLIIGGASGTATRLAKATDGEVLTLVSGAPAWASGGSGAFVGVRVYHNADQSTANATDVALAFNSERFDSDAFHDVTTNNSRLTIPSGKDGKYQITAHITWAPNGSGRRFVSINLNGTTDIARNEGAPNITSAEFTSQTVSTLYDLVATDYLEVHVIQGSGGSLAIKSSGNFSPEFMLVKVG